MRQIAKSIALAGVVSMAATAGPAVASEVSSTPSFLMTVPADNANVQPGGAFTSFDISWVDPVTGDYYVADRSNAAVSIFSASSTSGTLIGRATGFTGQAATTSLSGPNGVLTVTSGGLTTLYAGDGNSTLKVFNATNPASPALLQSISTGGSFRVDEMAYSPATQQLLAANNADSPAFGTLFHTTNGTAPVTISATPITIPGQIAIGGMEQPVWNPNTGSFFVSVPTFNGTDPGGVAQINTAGIVVSTFHLDLLSGGASHRARRERQPNGWLRQRGGAGDPA